MQLRSGDAAGALCSYEAAFAEYTKAWNSTHELRNQQALSQCLSGMGYAHMELGAYALARNLFGRALDVARQLSQQPMVANCVRGIADTYAREKNFPAALGKYTEALVLFQHLGLKKDIAICEHNMRVIEAARPAKSD